MGKNTSRRRELTESYKERKVTGGIYRITCTANGRFLLLSTTDIAGAQNRFTFAVSTGGCIIPSLRADWDAHGPQSFALEVLETLERKPDQNDRQFADDIAVLEEIWRGKTDMALCYEGQGGA